jgi:hypothetical protein
MANERARQLRNDMTDSERKLWRELSKRQLARHRFRRQHPLGPYVVDFVCLHKRFIVEVDGGQHSQPEQQAHGARHGSKPRAITCCGSGTRKCSTISTVLSKRFCTNWRDDRRRRDHGARARPPPPGRAE